MGDAYGVCNKGDEEIIDCSQSKGIAETKGRTAVVAGAGGMCFDLAVETTFKRRAVGLSWHHFKPMPSWSGVGAILVSNLASFATLGDTGRQTDEGTGVTGCATGGKISSSIDISAICFAKTRSRSCSVRKGSSTIHISF
jgi:hypothetical protein